MSVKFCSLVATFGVLVSTFFRPLSGLGTFETSQLIINLNEIDTKLLRPNCVDGNVTITIRTLEIEGDNGPVDIELKITDETGDHSVFPTCTIAANEFSQYQSSTTYTASNVDCITSEDQYNLINEYTGSGSFEERNANLTASWNSATDNTGSDINDGDASFIFNCIWPPTSEPTAYPTGMPTGPTLTPSAAPTTSPTLPTAAPSNAPSQPPTASPTLTPTPPTNNPTDLPSHAPTPATNAPTESPTEPTIDPTAAPTLAPTAVPTDVPTLPTMEPSQSPTLTQAQSGLTPQEVGTIVGFSVVVVIIVMIFIGVGFWFWRKRQKEADEKRKALKADTTSNVLGGTSDNDIELNKEEVETAGLNEDVDGNVDSTINFKEVYGEMIDQLVAMGFNDRDQNLNILITCDGDVEVAVEVLQKVEERKATIAAQAEEQAKQKEDKMKQVESNFDINEFKADNGKDNDQDKDNDKNKDENEKAKNENDENDDAVTTEKENEKAKSESPRGDNHVLPATATSDETNKSNERESLIGTNANKDDLTSAIENELAMIESNNEDDANLPPSYDNALD